MKPGISQFFQVLVIAGAIVVGLLFLRPFVPRYEFASLPDRSVSAPTLSTADKVILRNLRFIRHSEPLREAVVRDASEFVLQRDLWVDRCEVGAKRFQRFVTWYLQRREHDFCLERPCTRLHYSADEDHKVRSAQGQPASSVSFFDAYAFCRAAGGRLPTRAEWQAVASGTAGRLYPWGGEPDSSPWRDASPLNLWGQECGTFPTTNTPDGVRDLANNVSEWVMPHDDDEEGPMEMGGSYLIGGWDLYAMGYMARRMEPTVRKPSLGFRCVYDNDPARMRLSKASTPYAIFRGDDINFGTTVVERSKSKPVVAFFTANWSWDSQFMRPGLEAFAREAQGRWIMVEVDIERNSKTTSEAGGAGRSVSQALRQRRGEDGIEWAPSSLGAEEMAAKARRPPRRW